MMRQNFASSVLAATLAAGAGQAEYVVPQMGGGQIGMMTGAPMIHLDVTFDGVDLAVTADTSHVQPVFRSLTEPDVFDPAQPWAVLTGKAYNFQYGWNPRGFIALPTDAGIWIERLHHDAGLEAYNRPPATPAYAEIFEADGDRWMWSGAMTHNTYAVLDPTQPLYRAQYRVYLGDVQSGEPLVGYGNADITLQWQAMPVPEPGVMPIVGAALSALVAARRRRDRR